MVTAADTPANVTKNPAERLIEEAVGGKNDHYVLETTEWIKCFCDNQPAGRRDWYMLLEPGKFKILIKDLPALDLNREIELRVDHEVVDILSSWMSAEHAIRIQIVIRTSKPVIGGFRPRLVHKDVDFLSLSVARR